MITEQTFTDVRVSEVQGAKCNTAGKGLMSLGRVGGEGGGGQAKLNCEEKVAPRL